ncbi:PAS-domain containing protein [Cribrihabitans sp. XS_ASV171]
MTDWIVVATSAFVAAAIAVLAMSPRRRSAAAETEPDSKTANAVYLFDEDDLVDRSENAWPEVITWQDLRDRLTSDFPAFPATPSFLRDVGSMIMSPTRSGEIRRVFCEWINETARVQVELVATTTEKKESPSLQRAMDKAPYPVWQLDRNGHLRWYNETYSKLVHLVRGDGSDPDLPLFPHGTEQPQPGKKARVSIDAPMGDRKLWYDLTCVEQDDGFLCYAIDVNAVVDAEVAQRNFVQTLTKTFAQLPIGLAIFDRNRQLALFNPALIDLTGLPAQFLSGRPGLSGFFDRLRDQNLMPEPKNYGGWRQQMNALVEAAVDGRYQETWTLPSGSVYSVNGRPHPDGAIAFLFQDITAEITLTRRFRAELELGQWVLDLMDEAIAVFAGNGTLTNSNRAYRTLWKADPESGFAEVSVVDAMRNWQEGSEPTPIWGDIRDFVDLNGDRAEWSATFKLKNGKQMTCVVSPIQNSATLVRFLPDRSVGGQAPPVAAEPLENV